MATSIRLDPAIEQREARCDLGGTFDLIPQAREAQAAFIRFCTGATGLDIRIGKDERHPFFEDGLLAIDAKIALQLRGMGDIDDGQLEGDPDLRCRQANAVGLVHGFDHILGQRARLVRDIGDWRAIDAQHGVAINDNGQNHG